MSTVHEPENQRVGQEQTEAPIDIEIRCNELMHHFSFEVLRTLPADLQVEMATRILEGRLSHDENVTTKLSSDETLSLVYLLPLGETRTRIGTALFGPKLAGDLGIRSTASHPKTDYGTPHFSGDLDDFSE